ncbi:hypothetical protein K1719_019451 [Acacia pycnantha]|nr:hypothetical protein K1719_047268 [Acacia pycnantha]KAI9109397.1 hypothetical protein K1719_019451 [Acacia pycnantha]
MTSSAMKVTVISSDGDEFEIPINVAEQSILIQNLREECDGKIPLSNVNSATLSRVLEYCHKHASPEVAADEGGTGIAGGVEELKKWDADFLKTDKLDVIFDIILAANYMEIKSLLDFSCQIVSDMIKNKMPEEVRSIFNLTNDFTPDEEAQIRKENAWAFEEV